MEKDVPPPEGCRHVIQLYGSEQALVERAGSYLAREINMGRHVVAIATPPHAAAFAREWQRRGIEVAGDSAPCTFMDADAALAKILVNGYPDERAFDESVGAYIRSLAARSDIAGVSAYGEMAGALWKAKQFPSAIRLEQLWNNLLKPIPIRLFCSYQIDVFGPDFDPHLLAAVLSAHHELLPFDSAEVLCEALDPKHADEILKRTQQYYASAS
jgi:MEDS: MEthanogen/methylotroph, DcmR Sensory domain